MNYSLVEFKLRRFIHLGHKDSIYVPPIRQKQFWKDEKHYEIDGVKLIAQIIKKNKTQDIYSIVQIILKIEKEKKLRNYEYLLYLLAVCAKLNENQCRKMVTDVYVIITTILTDGLKLLMFYKFCNTASTILYEQGYLPKQSSGFGRGIQTACENWYLNRTPLETIKSIVKHKSYQRVNHKNIMNSIHLSSKDPRHQIYIVFVRNGIKKMKQLFGPKMLMVDNDDNDAEKSSKIQQLCIYNYILQVYRINDATDSKLIKDIKWNCLGRDFEVVTPKMLQSPRVSISFIQKLPLRTLLDNVYTFYRHGVFQNLMGNHCCKEFISRFRNSLALKESGIHPVESYLEFLRYVRSGPIIAEINKKKENKQISGTNLFEKNSRCSDFIKLIKKKQKNQQKNQLKPIKKKHRNISTNHLFKPIPVPPMAIQKFLSVDLMKKTFKNLTPSGRRILIAYDNRTCLKSIPCRYMHVKFLKVCDAIGLIIQSITYQEQLNKPTLCALSNPGNRFQFINVDCLRPVAQFEHYLFKKNKMNSKKYENVPNVKPLCTINWAGKKNQLYDVFLFLGSTKMDFNNIKKTKANYEALTDSKIKIIVCCLNGNHSQRVNLSRDGMLFIHGFDKNIMKIINLFINNSF